MTLREALCGGIPCTHYPEHRVNYEVAVFDHRNGKHYLGSITEDGEFMFPTRVVLEVDGRLDQLLNKPCWDWTHTDKTILIVL
jgi:hypothetical protein